MLDFDCGKYAYASRRNVVFARKGMACSCVPLASQVGIDTMKRGGNAMDAAIAMAATLPLVEPPATAWAPTASPWCGAKRTRSCSA